MRGDVLIPRALQGARFGSHLIDDVQHEWRLTRAVGLGATEKITKYFRIRRQTDVSFVITGRLRARINQALRKYRRGQPFRLSASMMKLLGCTGSELLKHLESRFMPGMSWENRRLWHIDHIRPLASFDLTDVEQQRIACHHTNLQPLWASDNIRKGARWR